MLALLVAICQVAMGQVTIGRAGYWLGPETEEVWGRSEKYLVSPRFPFTLLFTEEERLRTFFVRCSFLDTPAAIALRTKLLGKWLAFPIDLQPIDPERPWLLPPYNLMLSDDVMIIYNGFFPLQFFYRSTAIGPVLKIGVTFPDEKDRLAFATGRDTDHSLLSLYFVTLGPFAIGWRPVAGADFGQLTFYSKLVE